MATFPPKGFAPTPSPSEQWTKRFQEAERLVDEVTGNIAERGNVKEMRKLAEKLDALELKVKEVAAPFTMKKHSSNRNELLGPSDDRCVVVDIKSTANMENQEIVQLQRNIMKEQDECLDRLEESIVSTKHIALAINEELDLHVRLIDDLDEMVEDTSNQLQRVQKKLKSLNTRMRKSGSCTGILVSVIASVIFVAVVWALIKF
ncbi:Syntaxin-51 [Hordeum vulgare]|nr:Syntaxin-51 [Hordeum vulgare]